MPAPIDVFISFVQEDEPLRRALEAHLSALKRAGLISTWSDRRIEPGATFRNTIDARLEAAKVILLLVSADFLASDYCNDVEVARALDRARAKEALVILVRVRACDKELPQFERLAVLPRDGRAVTSWPNRDEAWEDVANGLREMIGELAAGLLPLPPASAPLPPPPDAPYDRRFYVHRAEEERRALAKLATPGAPVVIWGPWLSGKSWMLGYLLEQVQDADAAAGKQTTIIDVDLKSLLPEPATADGLLERFAYHLSRAAGVGEERFEKLAKGRHGWSDKLIELMEDHVLLPAARGRVLLVVEKADAVWGLGKVQVAFYQALRRWKERVAHKPSWSSLRLIFLLSTTPSLVFEDPEHADSPFANLTADIIELRDLLPAQALELPRMHGLDWDRETLDRLVTPLVGNNPYLLRVLMYRARMEGASIDALTRSPEALERLYTEHLRELGQLLERDQLLKDTVLRVLDDPRAEIDEDRFQRLWRAGVLARSADGEHRIPYQLYESYLRRRWKAKRPARP